MTLNPFKHIDPIGTIIVPAVLFITTGMMFGGRVRIRGDRKLNNPKRDMAIVAAAGPAANLIEALLASVGLFAVTGLVNALSLGDDLAVESASPALRSLRAAHVEVDGVGPRDLFGGGGDLRLAAIRLRQAEFATTDVHETAADDVADRRHCRRWAGAI